MQPPDFWQSRSIGWQARLLTPLSKLYTLGGQWRMANTTPFRAAIPVLCVGNLTLGGTGKTPVALALFEMLTALGQRPFFLTRGYGGSQAGPLLVDPAAHSAADVGDEPLLLAQAGSVIVARDRVAGAKLAQTEGATLILMDDGFQNPTLEKTLSLIVVDGPAGFGNGLVFPAGPLREPVAQGLARAQGVIVVGGDAPAQIGARPVFHARLAADEAHAQTLRGKTVLAFAGIGRPQKFFDTLTSCGAVLAGARSFPDHFPYAADDIEMLRIEATQRNATLITTQKDFVRLPPTLRHGIEVLPVRALFSHEAGLIGFLKTTLA